MKRRARLTALLAAVGFVLAWPAAASAHVANVEYRFPLPIWLYALAAALAVLASAPAAALAVRERNERLSRNLYPLLSRLRLGPLGLLLATVLLADALVGGMFGDQISLVENPGPLLIWVDFWVGLGLLSAFVGNIWDFVSPLSAACRWLDRCLAAKAIALRRYPDWLGVWPAVGMLLVWSWAELIWPDATRGRPLTYLLLGYLALQLVGAAIFGAEVWLARAELFTVVARTLARFSPIELYVLEADGECPAGRCARESERRGCPACWLAAESQQRGLRLRAYGAGLRREPQLGAGGGAFVVALLATVVYDGWRNTVPYQNFEHFLDPGAPAYSERLGTATILLAVTGFTLAFLAGCALVSLCETGGLEAIARRYAPTLIPIAAVYFASHYFVYWLYIGQRTPAAALDPLHHDWLPEYNTWQPLSGAAVWWIQVTLIVSGHIVSVWEAHRVSAQHHPRHQRALLAQAPLIALMATYTFSGLWVLGQSIKAI